MKKDKQFLFISFLIMKYKKILYQLIITDSFIKILGVSEICLINPMIDFLKLNNTKIINTPKKLLKFKII